MIHYMFLLGYILVTCHKNNIVTLHVTFMLYRRNKTCLLGNFAFKICCSKMSLNDFTDFEGKNTINMGSDQEVR